MAKAATTAIEGEISRLRSLALEELRGEWRRLYHAEPPQISRDLLVLGLGYRLQEIDQGGLGKTTRRKLQTIARSLRKTGRVGPTPSLALKPGARLVRECLLAVASSLKARASDHSARRIISESAPMPLDIFTMRAPPNNFTAERDNSCRLRGVAAAPPR